MVNQQSPPDSNELVIDRARLDSITVYDVTDDELSILEQGSPSSVYLNFAIALLSIAASLGVSLATTKIEDDRKFYTFLIITVLTTVIGAILLVLWYRTNKSSKGIFKKIRARKDTDTIRATAIAEQIEEPGATSESNQTQILG